MGRWCVKAANTAQLSAAANVVNKQNSLDFIECKYYYHSTFYTSRYRCAVRIQSNVK